MKSQKRPNAGPVKTSSSTTYRQPMARPGTRRSGKTMPLLTNHFRVCVDGKKATDAYFYKYNVSLTYKKRPLANDKGIERKEPLANAKDIGRKVMDKVRENYHSELAGKHFAYDGDKSLFTIGSLPEEKFQFEVVLEDPSSNRGESDPGRSNNSKTVLKVDISFATRIAMDSIERASEGQPLELSQDAIQALDIILRQHAANKGDCLVVRQSFFDNDSSNFIPLGSGVSGCRGFSASFRATQGGLFLNMDVSNTLIIPPGSVMDFLLSNQNINEENINGIDWDKAIRMLKNMRVKISYTNEERKIRGLSEKSCRNQTFEMKQRNEGPDGAEVRTKEVTVYEYFVDHLKIGLAQSVDLPCIDVGKSKHPVYIPVELCELITLQRYTKSLSTHQRSLLVEKSRVNPMDRMKALEEALERTDYDNNPMLSDSGISITAQFTEVDGLILPAPTLKAGNEMNLYPQNGRWNFNNRKLAKPARIVSWLVANFSSHHDMEGLIKDLIECAERKGLSIKNPTGKFKEKSQHRHNAAADRVDKMIRAMDLKSNHLPTFILCILPQKNCDIYGPWKRRCLSVLGVPTQCIAPPKKVNDQYLSNVVLKINAKLGGLNSLLTKEYCSSLRSVSSIPTLILGMDVSHGPPGQANMPSIAAVVNSRKWPSISYYRAAVCTQPPKSEMINSLFKSNSKNSGIIGSALKDFYRTSDNGKTMPEQIIIFRDGVGESQFQQVLDIELEQIIEACKLEYDKQRLPKFTVIVAQKRHHTRFFHKESESVFKNVPPGMIVDNIICDPKEDFYLCAHTGIGTTRPTHYHVLRDEIGFTVDDLQKLVHSLCYIYQRGPRAVSLVAPICYAHHAAAQVTQMFKPEDFSVSSSSHAAASSSQAAASSSQAAASSSQASVASSSHAAAAAAPTPKPLPFHKDVADSMFFC